MVEKSELAAVASQCSSVEDYISLAQRAKEELNDDDYARTLLTQAEMQCQFPGQYVNTAEAFCVIAGDKAYAADLLEQAEDACFEGMEYATVGCGYAALLGEREKGAQLFEQGMAQITEPAQILTLATMAETQLGDRELAQSLLQQIENECDTVAKCRDLAAGVIDSGNVDDAKALYQKASRYCDDIEQTLEYARGIATLFNDAEWVRAVLEEAEMDAQFPEQFVRLAQGFKDLLQDEAKVDALLDGGMEFAMSGSEYIDLAEGYRTLKQDYATAAELVEKGLPDVNERDALLALAKTAAGELSNAELAKKIYAKAESRITGSGDLIKLAESIFKDTADKDFAREIYARAEQQIVGSNELITLADHVMRNLGDKEQGFEILKKALDQAADFAASAKVLDAIMTQLPDAKDLVSSAIDKSRQMAESVPNFLVIHKVVLSALEDKTLADEILILAEQRVASLAEMKNVVQAVAEHNPEDGAWNQRVADKLQKRESNQKLYDKFQLREKSCETSRQFRTLAEEVIEKLEDPYYSRALFASAETLLDDGSFDLEQCHKLVSAIDQKLEDPDWVRRLIRKIADRANHLSETNQIAAISLEISDATFGKLLAGEVLAEAVDKTSANKNARPSDFIKLAGAVVENLGDKVLAKQLLEKAETIATDYLELSAISRSFSALGEQKAALKLLEKAAQVCGNPANLMKLIGRMKSYGFDLGQTKKIYLTAKNQFSDKHEQLQWAEGLVDIFNDTAGAEQAFDSLSEQFSDNAEDADAFGAVRLSRLPTKHNYVKPTRSMG